MGVSCLLFAFQIAENIVEKSVRSWRFGLEIGRVQSADQGVAVGDVETMEE